MYTILFTDDGLTDIKALAKAEKNDLKRALLNHLSRDPLNCSTPLREPLDGYRSFHHRDVRVVLKVYEQQRAIVIFGVGAHAAGSDDIYRRLEQLARQGRLAEKVLATLRTWQASERRGNRKRK